MAGRIGQKPLESVSTRAPRSAVPHTARKTRTPVSRGGGGSKADTKPFDVLDFRRTYGASPLERMTMIRDGIPADTVRRIAQRFNISQEVLMMRLGMSKSTISRKVQEGGKLTSEQSERLVGISKLVGQVEAIIEESGDQALAGDFNAATWLEDWLSHPNPSLGNAFPSTYLDTHEGREVVSTLIAQMQSGAYA